MQYQAQNQVQNQVRNHPRRSWLALFMSLVLPGFGQLYNGEVNKAIWLFIGFALLSVPGVALCALYLPSGWMMPSVVTGLILTLLIWLYGMVDAWRNASGKQEYIRKNWQISGVYAVIFLLCNMVALPLLMRYVIDHQVQSFRIPSSSMEPGVVRGDILFADKRYNCPGCQTAVQRGDVAIFTYPNNRTQLYIKRVIGLPGDHVRMAGHTVWINDKSLSTEERTVPSGVTVTEKLNNRQWQVQWLESGKPAADKSVTEKSVTDFSLTVGAGQAFVLGDNRNSTQDTRHFGTVPLQDIVGKAHQVWYSSSPHEGIRWERLGMLLD